MVAGMRVETPSPRHLAQDDPASLTLVGALQRFERALHLARLDLEHLGEGQDANRLVGHEHHRLKCTFKPFLVMFFHGFPAFHAIESAQGYPSATESYESSSS